MAEQQIRYSAEKRAPSHHENVKQDTHYAAEHGHAATDQWVKSATVLSLTLLTLTRYGHALVTFDKKAESRLRLKIDLMIVPTVALLYLFCFIDRANIGNARLAGLEKDLGLKKYDYNIVLSIFYISYIVFEVRSPSRTLWYLLEL